MHMVSIKHSTLLGTERVNYFMLDLHTYQIGTLLTLLGTKRVNYCKRFLLTKYQTTFVLTAWLFCARRLRGITCVNTKSANFCNKLVKPHILNVLMTKQISYLGDICSPMNLAGSKNYLTWPLQHPLRTFCLWVGPDCFLHDFSQAQFHYFLNLQMLNVFFFNILNYDNSKQQH